MKYFFVMLTAASIVLGCTSIDSLLEPGETHFTAQVQDNVSKFHAGEVIRLPGHSMMVHLRGSHYEMGLQYGVLMRDDFIRLLDYGRRDLTYYARDLNIDPNLLAGFLKNRAWKFFRLLPRRFQEELKGIAEGSGIKLDTIVIFSFLEAVIALETDAANACSSVVLTDPQGNLFHSWHRDDSRGEFIASNLAIIHYEPEGFLESFETKVLTMTGTEDGRNAAGLTVSTNSRATGARGGFMDYHFILRMIIEECENLDDVDALLKGLNAYYSISIHVSDAKSGKARIYELVPGEKMLWHSTDMVGHVQWNLNHYVNKELADKFENIFLVDSLYENIRKSQFTEFFAQKKDSELNFNLILKAMTLNEWAKSTDPFRTKIADSISNAWTTKMVIYGPKGIYIGNSRGYYASLGDIYLYPYDFSASPILIREKITVPTDEIEFAEIISGNYTKEQTLEKMKALADSYPQKAYFAYTTAALAWETQKKWLLWAEYSQRAYRLVPNDPEYAIEAACSYYAQKNYGKAKSILLSLQEENLYNMKYRFIRYGLLASILSREGNKTLGREYEKKALSLPILKKYKELFPEYLAQLEALKF